MINLFVYGTLRKNKEATHYINGWRVYDAGRFPYITKADAQDKVLGNLVEVDDETLLRYDVIEGTASGFYRRVGVKVKSLIDETVETDAEAYEAGDGLLSQITRSDPIAGNDWVWHVNKNNKRSVVFRPGVV